MKRIPLLSSFILFIALCASAAYWAMQFYQPPTRALIAPPISAVTAPELAYASGLFGGGVNAKIASHFQLTGVVVADHANDSVAIIAVEGKPASAFRLHTEIQSGVRVTEVQRDHVLLLEQGVSKRLDLVAESKTPLQVNVAPIWANTLNNNPAMPLSSPAAMGNSSAFTQPANPK